MALLPNSQPKRQRLDGRGTVSSLFVGTCFATTSRPSKVCARSTRSFSSGCSSSIGPLSFSEALGVVRRRGYRERGGLLFPESTRDGGRDCLWRLLGLSTRFHGVPCERVTLRPVGICLCQRDFGDILGRRFCEVDWAIKVRDSCCSRRHLPLHGGGTTPSWGT